VQIFHPPKLDFFSLTLLEVLSMAGRREQGGRMGSPEGGPTKIGCKRNFFIRVEEEQLCVSVMFVSQDRVVGNQQKVGDKVGFDKTQCIEVLWHLQSNPAYAQEWQQRCRDIEGCKGIV
jgi:hypothetical protein